MKWIIVLATLLALSYGDDDHHRFPMDLHDLGLTKQQHRIVEGHIERVSNANHTDSTNQSEKIKMFLMGCFKFVSDSEAFRAKSLEKGESVDSDSGSIA